MWAIIDNKGTLYSGKERDIKIIFAQIIAGEIQEKWHGDLKLIEIHAIHKSKNRGGNSRPNITSHRP